MRPGFRICVSLFLCLPLVAAGQMPSQDTKSPATSSPPPQHLPDAPSTSRSGPPKGAASTDSKKFQANVSNSTYQPLTDREKFDRFLKTTVSPYTFASAAMNATWLQVNGEPYAYGGGMNGWMTRFGAKMVDTEVRSFFSQFFFPTLLNQDPRYFPKGDGNVVERGWYAGTRVLVVRTDSGKATFNSSYLLSVAFSRALANAYAPEEQRNLRNTLLSIVGAYGGDAGSYVLREFWPDIMRLFRRHAPERVKQIEEKIPGELIGLPQEPVNSGSEPADDRQPAGHRGSPSRKRDCTPRGQCPP
jgi:hypothetical protein